MIDLDAPERSRSAHSSDAGMPRAAQNLAGQGHVFAADGVPLHYRSWRPTYAPASAALLFVHGIASHGGWFSETAAYLADHGIAVYAPDRRGSGLSGGPRGHLGRYEQALDDLGRCLDLVAEQQPGRPLFLAGSSWAARMVIAYAASAQGRLAGLVLLSPGLFPSVNLTLGQKLAVLVLHRLRPKHQLTIPLTPESFTRVTSGLAYIRRDEHRLLTASTRLFWETRRLDRVRDRLATRLTLPILLQLGEADPITDPAATCRWLHGLRAPDRTSVVYRDAAHTLDFEPEQTRRAYRADLLDWLGRKAACATRGRS
jgi:alpha-beta hydrolase superfamily lysophospholipase